MKSETLRRTWALFAGALIFAAAGSARAQDASAGCLNDPDCPDMTCGGQVCQYGISGQKCVAAGTDAVGKDGWCSVDSDCKCLAMGAKCVPPYCTFTKAPAGGAGGSTGAGGSASTGAGGTSSTGTAGTAAPAPADSGGCAIASTPVAGLTATGVLVGLGAIAFGARRRRRAA